MSQRTPLAKVRGLGSAREGTEHFWKQRLTAVSNLVLVCIPGRPQVHANAGPEATVAGPVRQRAAAV
jgi:succinate dehydrogenase / fumarate reductase membrane anchor subunit